jgi:hypothetical protein
MMVGNYKAGFRVKPLSTAKIQIKASSRSKIFRETGEF